jgi:pimeloyl-ACP methyl ester carboxylesterase
LAGNRATLAVYGGSITDPTLLGRLAGITVPALVLWGEADRIGDVDYGRALAAAIPGARFEVLEGTGHLPQMETPDVLLEALKAFIGE